MNRAHSKVIGAGGGFLIIFLSGFWLSQSGWPLNTGIFAIHKFIAVGAAVFLAVTVYRTNQLAQLSTNELVAATGTGLLFLGTIVTGSLLSIGRSMPEVILRLHQITPYLTALCTTATLYLLSRRQEEDVSQPNRSKALPAGDGPSS
jgi:hypothetical protein